MGTSKPAGRLLCENADYYNALKTLKETLPMATPDQRRTLLAKMVQWFEDIYINNQADNSLSAVNLWRFIKISNGWRPAANIKTKSSKSWQTAW